jgi:hypothetical protein
VHDGDVLDQLQQLVTITHSETLSAPLNPEFAALPGGECRIQT